MFRRCRSSRRFRRTLLDEARASTMNANEPLDLIACHECDALSQNESLPQHTICQLSTLRHAAVSRRVAASRPRRRDDARRPVHLSHRAGISDRRTGRERHHLGDDADRRDRRAVGREHADRRRAGVLLDDPFSVVRTRRAALRAHSAARGLRAAGLQSGLARDPGRAPVGNDRGVHARRARHAREDGQPRARDSRSRALRVRRAHADVRGRRELRSGRALEYRRTSAEATRRARPGETHAQTTRNTIASATRHEP